MRTYDFNRGLATLIGAAIAGGLIWVAGMYIDDKTTGGYWAVYGIIAGAGLVMALSQLVGKRLEPVGHQVEEHAALQTERRPVEFVVADKPVVLVAARAREANVVHGRMGRARQALEGPERGQRDAAPPLRGAGEGVAAGERVVHGPFLRRVSDAETSLNTPRTRRKTGLSSGAASAGRTHPAGRGP